MTNPSPAQQGTALMLGVLAVAFLARVAGQAIVMVANPVWLPPAEEWYSGLVPYPVLLPVQLGILALQWQVSHDLWLNCGTFARQAPRVGRVMRWVAVLYFVVMVLRYAVTMTMFPERRWLGHAIPIVFHWVLALYLFVWGRYLSRPVDAHAGHD